MTFFHLVKVVPEYCLSDATRPLSEQCCVFEYLVLFTPSLSE